MVLLKSSCDIQHQRTGPARSKKVLANYIMESRHVVEARHSNEVEGLGPLLVSQGFQTMADGLRSVRVGLTISEDEEEAAEKTALHPVGARKVPVMVV